MPPGRTRPGRPGAALDERARALGALRRDLEVRVAALEERRSMLSARRAELAEGIARRYEEHRRAEERRGAHEVEDLALSRLAARLQGCESKVVEGVGRLGAERDRRAEASRQRLERVGALRRQRDEAERSLAAGRERRQRLELELTEARIRHETAVEALHRDLDAVPDEAIAAPRPDLPEGSDPAARCARGRAASCGCSGRSTPSPARSSPPSRSAAASSRPSSRTSARPGASWAR